MDYSLTFPFGALRSSFGKVLNTFICDSLSLSLSYGNLKLYANKFSLKLNKKIVVISQNVSP